MNTKIRLDKTRKTAIIITLKFDLDKERISRGSKGRQIYSKRNILLFTLMASMEA
jgi:hypothetical protein